MSFILTLSKILGLEINQAVSIDPYFEDGYIEGKYGPWGNNINIDINKTSKYNAIKLYSRLGLNVKLIEKISDNGLRDLLCKDVKFNLIYVDGSHEKINPLKDIAQSILLLEEKGIIMLDDPHWPDVNIIKKLLDRHLKKVSECWKVTAYIKDDK